MIPKPKIVLLMVLWIAAVLFGIFDVVGPILGAPPPQSNSTNGTAGTPGQDDTGTSGTDTDATNGSNSSSSGGGIAYPYTKVIPEGIHQAYGTYHWSVYVLPLLYSLKLFLWCRKIRKKAVARKAFISKSLRTIPIYPYTKDTTPWTDSSVLGDGLYYALSGWPQAEPANRPEYGFFMCLGVAAHVGEGIRYYANVPVPPPPTPAAGDKGSSTSVTDPATAAGATSPAPASAGDSSTSPVWRGLEEEIEEVGEEEDDDETIEEVGASPHSAEEEDDEEYSFTEGRPGTNILAPNPLKAENTKEAEVSAISTDQGEGEGEAGKVKGDIEENIVDWQQRQEIEEEQEEENGANVYSA